MNFQSTKILLRADDTVVQIRDKSGFLPVHHAVKAGNLETALLVSLKLLLFVVMISASQKNFSFFFLFLNSLKILSKYFAMVLNWQRLRNFEM